MKASARRTKRQSTSSSQRDGSPSTASASSSSASGTFDVPNSLTEVGRDVNLEINVDDLDESLSYVFTDGQAVWVKEDEDWIPGVISGGSTRSTQARGADALSFPVVYGQHKRRYFAPLNGDIKPDTQTVRNLLQEGGWL